MFQSRKQFPYLHFLRPVLPGQENLTEDYFLIPFQMRSVHLFFLPLFCHQDYPPEKYQRSSTTIPRISYPGQENLTGNCLIRFRARAERLDGAPLSYPGQENLTGDCIKFPTNLNSIFSQIELFPSLRSQLIILPIQVKKT